MYADHDDNSEEEDIEFRTQKKRGRNLQNTPSKRARHDVTANVTETSLFNIVKRGKTAMTAVVDDWIEAYETHRNLALLDLMQFFVNAAGCKGVVTEQMIENATEGFQDIIKRMTEEFDEDSGDYPLIASGAQFKRFKSSFSDFVQALVRQCQFQIIYDQVMMDHVLTLLTELSNSQVRAFRHTSTLAAMKLMSGLVNVALQLNVSLDNTQRQYDAEQSKTASKRASEKLDILLQKRRELEEQQTEIEGMLNGIFKGIFVHRYRDYIAELRALCMEEIGVWMKLFPKVFLTDSYLKYVGWTLHDKQKEVRMKCLQTLSALYSDNDMTQDLKLFTSRFKGRIVSMSLDRESDVAVLAIKLLTLIHSNCGYDTPVLTDVDCDSIYQLVYSSHRPMAVAAAEFLHKQIFSNKDESPGYTKRGRKRSPNTPMIINLVLFFIESDFHEHATYLVDSLWDVASSMLKDWDCMSDLLLEEPAKEEDVLDEKQESSIIDIMVCAIKQASEGIPPTGRQGYSKKIASRDRKQAIEDTLLLTEHFIVALPNLLKKFQMDQEKVAGLLQIPKYFNLEVYSTNRLEKHLGDLLEQIVIILDKYTASPILEQVSMAYNHLHNDENTIYDKVSVSLRNVLASKLDNFQIALGIFKDAGNEVENEEVHNVNRSLKKLVYMYKYNDLSYLNLFNEVFWIITAYQEKPSDVFKQMLGYAVDFIFYDLVYGLNKVKEMSLAPNRGNPDELNNRIADLENKVATYIQHCQFLLVNCPYQIVKEESFISICDLLVIFAPQLLHTYPNFKTLVQRAPESLQHILIDFVNDYIFIEVEEDEDDDDAKINALHRRRLLLAGVCKLVVYNMINMTVAASIFQQYIRFYTDYGDIIKETISRARHINKLACAQTLGLSLMKFFVTTVANQGGVLDQSSQEYGHMKELARRFALTFGLDLVKTREAVAELHKNGILFSLKRKDVNFNEATAPENLGFLGILAEFSAKLMKQDKKTIVQYLEKRIKPFMLSNQDQAWIPLVSYRSSLVQGMDDEPKKRGRKKKNVVEEEFEAPPTPQSPATFNPQQMPMAPQTPLADIGPPILNSTMIRNGQPNSTMPPPENSSIYYSSQQMAGTSQGGSFLQTPMQNQQLSYIQQGEQYQDIMSPPQQRPYYGR